MKRPSEEQIIAYLYGELSSEEQSRMEELMSKDKELANEMAELKGVRRQLASIEDEEVVEPFFFNPSSMNQLRLTQSLNKLFWNPVTGIAATLIVLFVLGAFFQVRVDFQGSAMTISTVDSEQDATDVTDFLTREEALDLFQTSMSENDDLHEFENRWKELSTEQNAQFASMVNQQNQVTEKVIGEFVTQLQKDNMTVISRLLEMSQKQQEQYMQNVLNDFTQYLEAQRESDLEEIEQHIVNLEQTQQVRNLETDQLLAGIINTVNNQYQNE